MNTQIAILMLILVTAFSGSVTAKDYTRSCDCQLNLGVDTVNGHSVVNGPSKTYAFSGQGTVGYYNPNEARRRARHNLDECIQSAWDNRNGVWVPSECTEANQIYDYPFTNGLIPQITNEICNEHLDYNWFTMALSATFSGNTGCLLDRNLWLTNIITNYRVNCPTRPYASVPLQ